MCSLDSPVLSSPEGETGDLDTTGTSGLVSIANGGPIDEHWSSENDNPGKLGDSLVFYAPATRKGTVIPVFENCINGVCCCIHSLAGNKVQIKPCRVASVMFDKSSHVSDDYWLLYCGLVDGFDIVDSEVLEYDCQNYDSILKEGNKEKMDSIIRSELENGMISESESKPHCIHALGAVTKPNGDIRPITDCGQPSDKCVNENMDSLVQKFRYKSVDNVVDLLQPGDYMSVIDIKSAYRSVPINPDHSIYQGLRWRLDGEEKFFIDRRLCFGLKCGPFYFNLLSEFVYNECSSRYDIQMVNYLDDFICVSRSYDECIHAQFSVIQFLRFIGMQISWSKVTPPSQVTIYLGITIDSLKMELRLPENKVGKMKKLVADFKSKSSATKHQLECLTGLLAHCATVVRGGRTFCRRLYDAHKVACNTKSKCVRLNAAAKADIEWWSRFAELFNGKATILNAYFASDMTSDASLKGFAVYINDDWAAGTWSNEISVDSSCQHIACSPSFDVYDNSNINVLELWPVLIGCHRWAHRFRNTRIRCWIDNMQVVYMLRTGRSSNPTCMGWLREIFWLSVLFNFSLEPEYIPSECNVLADTLSRVSYPKTACKLVELIDVDSLCCGDTLLHASRSVAGGTTPENLHYEEKVGSLINLQGTQEPMEVL